MSVTLKVKVVIVFLIFLAFLLTFQENFFKAFDYNLFLKELQNFKILNIFK